MRKIFILVVVILLLSGCNNKPKNHNPVVNDYTLDVEYNLDANRYCVGKTNANPKNGYLVGNFKCENCGYTMPIWIAKGYQWKDILPDIICPKCNINICTIETVQKYSIVSGD